MIKILTTLAFLAMVTVNALANSLPINGVSTGGVSDSYPNLFAPAGITFSIWGLIYFLLALYTVYQFGFFQKGQNVAREAIFRKVGGYYLASSIANILWIFAWHYDYILASVIFMLVLLYSLIKIANITRQEKISNSEHWLIRVPFSVYFGWITVATIANITVFLVSVGWNGFGIAESLWMIVALFLGAVIGMLRMLKDNNIAYGLVLVWAYSGILLKHMSAAGFNGAYPGVIGATIVCLLIFLIGLFVVASRPRQSQVA